MLDKAKLLAANIALKAKTAGLEWELSNLRRDMDRHMTILTAATTENEELRGSLKDAREALNFFKNWGESLNQITGYEATPKSWRPILTAMARIDALLATKAKGRQE